MESLVGDEILNETLRFSTTKLVKVKNETVRLIRLSFVGELGFELHIPKSSCEEVYTALMKCSAPYKMKLAGYRALDSLSCEKGIQVNMSSTEIFMHSNHLYLLGYLLWNSDLREDDNPIEAGLGFACRKFGKYLGKTVVDRLRKIGIKKRLVHIHVNR